MKIRFSLSLWLDRSAVLSVYNVNAIVERYMQAVEEVITIPTLIALLETQLAAGRLPLSMDEIIHQSELEFNYPLVDG